MLAPLTILLAFATAAPTFTLPQDGGEERLRYLYDLTTPNGKVTLAWPALSADPDTHELYLLFGGAIRVFNPTGMEVFRFRETGDIGQKVQVLAADEGDLFVVSLRDGKKRVIRCDYRGRPTGELTFSNVPPELKDFSYAEVVRSGTKLYFFDPGTQRTVITDLEGAYVGVVDFHGRVAVDPDVKDGDRETRGFAVDAKGNLYVGFPLLFYVAVIGPDGSVRGFGQKGSVAGKFNVVAAVAADEDGYVYVADILKGAVMAFDPQFRFVGQVSGLRLPGGLLYSDGKVFVTQGGESGTAVFEVIRKKQPPVPSGTADSARPERVAPTGTPGSALPARAAPGHSAG